MEDKLVIRGAREHNLKNINLEINKNSLTVITGLSGSGKSSLAFDTIFAEGQRRYVESLSSYARQFLGRLDKPNVDYIEGLSPAISIEQKTTNKNPRSTVGTITEIYDYYRLLWARIGEVRCPECHRIITTMTVDEIIDALYARYEDGSRIMVLSPVVLGRKGEYRKLFEDAVKQGFQRAYVDSSLVSLSDRIELNKQEKHNICIVVDRLILKKDSRMRLADSIEKSVAMADGLVQILSYDADGKETTEIFSQKNSCPHCGISIGDIEPRLFSFNNPFGACEKCNGLGYISEYDIDKIIPDRTKSFNQGAIATMNPNTSWGSAAFKAFAAQMGFTADTPFCELNEETMNVILYGSDKRFNMKYEDKMGKVEIVRRWKGVVNDLKRRWAETESPMIKAWISSFQKDFLCPDCHGERLKKEALNVFVGGKNINEVTAMSVKDSIAFFDLLSLSPSQEKIAHMILKEIKSRLYFLADVGLGYLTLNRNAGTLSGGEGQRIRLATQIGSALSGVLYVLDEPSIGLHQRDNRKLINTLFNLRNLGNTVLVVEHDEETIRSADYIVDMGPGAGENGGYVIATGTPQEIEKNKNSITGAFLSGREKIEIPASRRKGNGKTIELVNVNKNNVHGESFSFPLGKLVVLTGVSGSGKSTVLNQVLVPAIKTYMSEKKIVPNGFDSITGLENIDKLISIDQSPIGKTPRSNPATYVGLFDHIRDLFASLPESRARSYSKGRFSFNVPGGRCEHCHGDGTIKVEMNFLPDVFVTCDVCHGRRFNKETLDIRYKGKNIDDVLNMTVSQAYSFFEAIPPLKRKLKTLCDVGLDYIRLGQSALTLSGGEAQRVKLALELSKVGTGKTLYVLDEPTTGLHNADVKKLLEVLNTLVNNNNTVMLIEHNLDVIKQADWLIDLGPEGGDGGGKTVAVGTPETVAKNKASFTGMYLKEIFEKE